MGDGMEIHGKEVEIEQLLEDLKIEKNFLKRRQNGFLLNDKQIEVLNRHDIHYLEYSNLSSLLYAMNEMMNEEVVEDQELEQVFQELEEIHYYQETGK